MLRNFFKTAWRSLLRNKAVTTINVFGLALGITVCLIVFLLVKYELGYDRFHPGGDRIYRVVATSARGDGFSFVPAPASDDARAELSGLERVAGFDTWFPKVTAPQEGKPNRVFEAPERGETHPAVILVQPEYFDIFPYRWLAGNAATALDDPFRVVLTANEATKYFGRQDPDQWLGRRLIYSDSLEVTVSGIVADWEGNTDLGFMDFISHSTIKSSWLGHLMGGMDGRIGIMIAMLLSSWRRASARRVWHNSFLRSRRGIGMERVSPPPWRYNRLRISISMINTTTRIRGRPIGLPCMGWQRSRHLSC